MRNTYIWYRNENDRNALFHILSRSSTHITEMISRNEDIPEIGGNIFFICESLDDAAETRLMLDGRMNSYCFCSRNKYMKIRLLESPMFHVLMLDRNMRYPAFDDDTFVIDGMPVKLSGRDVMMIRLIASGYDSHQIASIMNLTLRSVQNRRYQIYEKTGMNSMSQLAVLGRKIGPDPKMRPL